ncbi:MerR family transcriptional regulator [Saccharothrix sp.]|uniref:MerR family transcriptional regulator n=1 Tax=Saccharothrix sp. TaxID=1873460 RepID=UPI0028116997|nr:MerR family transcriptional regulator [Saccharothrix sp.]
MLIGDLSARTGVSPRLLRYYESQGLLETSRAANGYRHYDDTAVTTVRQIRALLGTGLSTQVIRSLLPCTYGDEARVGLCPEVRAILTRELAALDERIADLQQSRGALAAYLP